MNLTLKPSTKLPGLYTNWLRPDSVFDQNLWNLKSGFIPMHLGVDIPPVNIKETPTEFILEVAAPGLERKDFHVNVENHLLKISVEKEEKKEKKEKENGYWRKEYSYHSFCRSFTLPDHVKEGMIDAHYDKGILLVHVAKEKQTTTKAPRKIAIS